MNQTIYKINNDRFGPQVFGTQEMISQQVKDLGWGKVTKRTGAVDTLIVNGEEIAEEAGYFSWNASDGTWCLSGTTRDGNGWETDDFEAANEDAAIGDAIQYLETY